jgi:hypothetical protein
MNQETVLTIFTWHDCVSLMVMAAVPLGRL